MPTVAISLIRLHTERIENPRSLWVPFELGRPLGPPRNAGFQLKVLTEALALLAAKNGPVVLADFPDEDPTSRPAELGAFLRRCTGRSKSRQWFSFGKGAAG